MRQLYTTGVPLPFDCYYAARVPDCRSLERTLHYVFGEKRVSPDREFFKTDPDLAKAIIELVAIKEEPVSADLAPPLNEDSASDEPARQRSKALTLAGLGLEVGTELVFVRDPTVTCKVAGPRTVSFNGQELSISTAALQAIHAMGYTWPSVNGFDYWMLEGVKLSALARLSNEREAGLSTAA